MNFLDLIKSGQTIDEDSKHSRSSGSNFDEVASKVVTESADKRKNKPKFVPNSAILTDDEYFAVVNPKTQMRFDIPMLMGNDTQYFVKYVKYMKLRQSNPEEFNQIMEWN